MLLTVCTLRTPYHRNISLSALILGVHATLFFMCFTSLWAQRKTRSRHAYAWMSYISLLFILGSITNGIDMRLSQVVFVDYRSYPAGPAAFTATTYTVPINILCTAACMIGGWLQDALLVRLPCFFNVLLTAHLRLVSSHIDIPIPRYCISSVVRHGRSYYHLYRLHWCVFCRFLLWSSANSCTQLCRAFS